MNIKPPKLEIGSKIGVFASSSPANMGLDFHDTYSYLIQKGLIIYEHPQCRKQNGHTAGTIEERVNAFHEMVSDPSIKALIAYWGGTNTNQILPYLDFELIKNNPKIIIGFSDTTSLLLAITNKTELITFMGPAIASFFKPHPFEYTWDSFYKTCILGEDNILIKDSQLFAEDAYYLREDNDHRIVKKNYGRKIYRHGKIKGEIIAANLETLLSLSGTEFFPKLDGKILLVEESENTNVSMIHRHFTQLSQIIDLSNLKGVLIGRFCTQSGFKDNDSFKNILDDVFKTIDFPIIYNLDFGHSDPLFTIPNGGIVHLDTLRNEIIFRNAVI